MKRLIAIAGVFALTGCGASIDDLVAYTQQVKANTQVSIEPYPVFNEFESVDYGASNMRSPFGRSKDESEVSEIESTPNCTQPDRQRVKFKLERFGLDALQMSGVLELNGKRYALIKPNDGSLHRVAIGSYVGLFHGRVTQINDREITIQEMLPDGAGCWQPKTATISMSSAAGDNN